MNDNPRHAWKTDIGTGFIGGSSNIFLLNQYIMIAFRAGKGNVHAHIYVDKTS